MIKRWRRVRTKRCNHSKAATAKIPTRCNTIFRRRCRTKSGIVRNESEMNAALEALKRFWEREHRVGVTGNREFNPGWHTALDLKNLLTVSEAVTRAALERKESRGAQFREDYPNKDDRFAKVNTIVWQGDDGSMQVRLDPLPEMPDYLKQVIEEMK